MELQQISINSITGRSIRIWMSTWGKLKSYNQIIKVLMSTWLNGIWLKDTAYTAFFSMDSGGYTGRICSPNQHQYNSSGCLSLPTEQPDPPPSLVDSSIRQPFLLGDWRSLLFIATVAQSIHLIN